MTVDLVERARSGDHAAFSTLAAAAIDRLFAIARRVLRDEAAAEDAVQDCLLQAWRDIRALRDPARFDAWIYRLLLNACRDEQRRSMRRPLAVVAEDVDLPSASDETADVVRRDELERGFRSLSTEHRMALVLHHYQGLRAREIADLMGIPEGTVVSRLHYASRALRIALEPEFAPTGAQLGGRS